MLPPPQTRALRLSRKWIRKVHLQRFCATCDNAQTAIHITRKRNKYGT